METSPEETQYKWFEAAKFYEKELRSQAGRAPSAAILQKIGYCYNFASRQAANLGEFEKLRELAASAYGEAAGLYGEQKTPEGDGKAAQCAANRFYMLSWLVGTPSERKETLGKSCDHALEAIDSFKKVGDELSQADACVLLATALFDLLGITAGDEEKRKVARAGLENAKEAITLLAKLGEKEKLVTALSVASIQSWYFANISDQEAERRELANCCLTYSNEAVSLSKELKNAYSTAMSRWAATLATMFFTDEISNALAYAKEMLHYASITKDNYFLGMAYNQLATVTDSMVPEEVDPTKKKQKHEEVIRYSEEAVRYLQLVRQDSTIADTYFLYAESLSFLARESAVTLIEKTAFSKKAISIGEKGLDHATRSGSPEAIAVSLHALSKACHFFADLGPRKVETPELLNQALAYRKEYVKTVQKSFASNFWTLGVGMIYAAQMEADLATLEKDEQGKVALLEDTVSDMEKGVALCRKWIDVRAAPYQIAIVAAYEDTLGGMLNERYFFTEKKEDLDRANQAFNEAAEKFKKVDMPSRVAESYWKIAGNFDCLGEYLRASENFERAFAGYKVAAEKIEQFGDFYLDYASYMKAWSEIETAKLSHGDEKYTNAMQHYERAATLLRQSKQWSYLSSNFHAWSLLEQAEDLSRKEMSRESAGAFEKAVNALNESKRSLAVKMETMSKTDEKTLGNRLLRASGVRVDYCGGRIAIEEARLLDKQGDHVASSEKYGLAAAIFQRISETDKEQIGRDAKPLAYLCQAWEKMTLAEARSSPILYEEASELFNLANQHSPTESASMLAVAHSTFCKALECGTEFEITRSEKMYLETKKYMDVAANHYLKAGFETASEYAKATQRLFDAYVFMNKAKRETDPEREAKYYVMAEKVLQNSAESFTKAKHEEKTLQVQKLLEKVKEEKDLALSLSEVFHAPTLTASTASFATISPSEETAAGLERFEHADIEAKLIQHGSDVKIGERIDFEIQIMNVGKEPVFLTKIENLLPTGFQLVDKPEMFSQEDRHLILKNKRLDPLKTDEIKVVLKPFKVGSFEIDPRILCVDETGHQLFHEPESKAFNVAPAVLAGRVTTGTADLDALLLGGIPEKYAIVITSPSSDERENLLKKFVEAGPKEGQITFYVTAEPSNWRALAEQFPSCFYLFICNPRSDVMIQDLPNVFKLKGVESLTDIDIALAKSFRTLNPAQNGPRRACIEIVSDVLLQHHAVITRKWLSGLLPDLRAKGFTTLAVVNPHMHPPEEVQAILGLFEGEIRISERETAKGVEQVLRIRKLYNQRYLENELVLTKERFES